MKIKPLDIFSIILVSGFIALLLSLQAGESGRESRIRIKTAAKEYIYSLKEDRVIHAAGPLGDTIIEIKNGRVKVLESPCREKLCIIAGSIEHNGEFNACLPNRVFINIEGEEESAYDSLSY